MAQLLALFPHHSFLQAWFIFKYYQILDNYLCHDSALDSTGVAHNAISISSVHGTTHTDYPGLTCDSMPMLQS